MKGMFKPRNPKKYNGNPTNIIYRSQWELKYMMELDADKNVIKWSSEEVIIHYISPIDNRWHRYFVDFHVVRINKQGLEINQLIENLDFCFFFKMNLRPLAKKSVIIVFYALKRHEFFSFFSFRKRNSD